MSRAGIGRAIAERAAERGEAIAPGSSEIALLTEFDGSPIAPARAWPPAPSGAPLVAGLLIVLDTAARGGSLLAVPGWQETLTWPLVTVLGLAWLGGVGLLALPAVALASRPAPPTRRALLAGTTFLALTEVCVALTRVPFVSNALSGGSIWPALLPLVATLLALLWSLAFVGGVALVGVALGAAGRATPVAADDALDRRSRLLAIALGLPAGAAILVYLALALPNIARAPVAALAEVPYACLPAAGAWLAWVSLRARSRVPVRRFGWAAAASAGLLLGFNQSSQHRPVDSSVAARRRLLPASSSRASCGAWC
jgi:hypothetical protein